jgi:hypothetical protein
MRDSPLARLNRLIPGERDGHDGIKLVEYLTRADRIYSREALYIDRLCIGRTAMTAM